MFTSYQSKYHFKRYTWFTFHIWSENFLNLSALNILEVINIAVFEEIHKYVANDEYEAWEIWRMNDEIWCNMNHDGHINLGWETLAK